jgi:hypothetical protein
MKANVECCKCKTVFDIEIDTQGIWQQETCTGCGNVVSVVAQDVSVRDGALDDNKDKDPDVSLAEDKIELIEEGKGKVVLDIICWAEDIGEALNAIYDGEKYNNPELVKKSKERFNCAYMFMMNSLKSYKKGVSQKVVFGNEKKKQIFKKKSKAKKGKKGKRK